MRRYMLGIGLETGKQVVPSWVLGDLVPSIPKRPSIRRSPPLDVEPSIQQAVLMKATFNLPDELYREVKARSALEGRPVRAVVIKLFQQWLGQRVPGPEKPTTNWKTFEPPLRRFVPTGVRDHTMESMRKSITRNFEYTTEGVALVSFEKSASKLPDTEILDKP